MIKKNLENLVLVAVEFALLEMGPSEFEVTISRLKKDYNCTISDCLDHPEYLKKILCELYGEYYNSILDTIKEVIKQDIEEDSIKKFLNGLEK